MKVYTKTGDDGTTGLLGGRRTLKYADRIRAIGDVDELNAALGLAATHESPLQAQLKRVQSLLFDIGAELAATGDGRWEMFEHGRQAIEMLERSIDRLSESLEPLKDFVLPGGTRLAAELHHARAVCRRAERTVLELDAKEPLRREIMVFLNRLSDWLFVAARTANASSGVPDEKWQKSETA